MSTTIGTLHNTVESGSDIQVTQYYAGEIAGKSLQLTNKDNGDFIQLSAADLIALMPTFEMIIKDRLSIEKEACEKLINENKELKKSILSDIDKVCDMAINLTILDTASMLAIGKKRLSKEE